MVQLSQSKIIAVNSIVLQETLKTIFLVLIVVEITEVSVVLPVILLRVGQGFDRIRVELHAVLDTLVQDLLGLI